jgi:hypothetical protein
MIMLAVAVVTAFISVNGAVAALLPVVVMACTRLRRQPSQMLRADRPARPARGDRAGRHDRAAGQRGDRSGGGRAARGRGDGAAGRVSVPPAYRAISWTTVVLVGGMIPLSTAMQQTGAAEHLAHLLVEVVGEGSPYLLLLALAVLTATLGQLISNTATALMVIPIAVSAAADLGVSVRPVLMAVTVAAAAAFLTPGGDAGEPDGDGPRRVPLRRLLAARPAPAAALRGRRDVPGAGLLAVLTAGGDPCGPSDPGDAHR